MAAPVPADSPSCFMMFEFCWKLWRNKKPPKPMRQWLTATGREWVAVAVIRKLRQTKTRRLPSDIPKTADLRLGLQQVVR